MSRNQLNEEPSRANLIGGPWCGRQREYSRTFRFLTIYSRAQGSHRYEIGKQIGQIERPHGAPPIQVYDYHYIPKKVKR